MIVGRGEYSVRVGCIAGYGSGGLFRVGFFRVGSRIAVFGI